MKFTNMTLKILMFGLILMFSAVSTPDVNAFSGGEHLWLGDTGYLQATLATLTQLTLTTKNPVNDPDQVPKVLFEQLENLGISREQVLPELVSLGKSELALLVELTTPIELFNKSGSLSYGSIVALGDFFGTPGEIYKYDDGSNDTTKVTRLLALFKAERDGAIDGKVGEVYDADDVQLVLQGGNYLELALVNSTHFVGHNLQTYLHYHRQAIELACQAHESNQPILRQNLWNEARFIGGFADHFLTDMFSSGHMRVPRQEIITMSMNLGYVPYEAGLMSKIIHDTDSKGGVAVENAARDNWVAYGDTYLLAFGNQDDAAHALEATKRSALDLMDALTNCTTVNEYTNAERFTSLMLVPFLDPINKPVYDKLNVCLSREQRQDIVTSISYVQREFGGPYVGSNNQFTTNDLDILLRQLPFMLAEFERTWSAKFAEESVFWQGVPPELKLGILSVGDIDNQTLINYGVAAIQDILNSATSPTGAIRPLSTEEQLEIKAILTTQPSIIWAIPEPIREKLTSYTDIDTLISAEIDKFDTIHFENPCDGLEAPDQPVITVVPTVMQGAQVTVSSNAEWQALYPNGFQQEFEGVPMVLVPKGCFLMGTTEEQAQYAINELGTLSDLMVYQKPSHEICFDEPFWIDRTEVTQGDFERLGGEAANESNFSGDNRPVESITWYEARDFCALRGERLNAEIRLPTEAEWEYAARGPDSLIFPWGDDYVVQNAVWNTNSTADVGSIPAGASWIGALDMSGNVWEWTSSLENFYPYDKEDGREDPNRKSLRSPRGGSWANDYFTKVVYPTLRFGLYPDYSEITLGFRCALSYNSSGV